jgi:hypothetical protein
MKLIMLLSLVIKPQDLKWPAGGGGCSEGGWWGFRKKH